jgi:3-hydroxyacyl-[acyl-carrier-protein] dehydratase
VVVDRTWRSLSLVTKSEAVQEDAVRFTLLDRVVAIEPGKSITAVKGLSLSEEYLADHFPRFPVMPGVLMLEAMTQAAAWTIRLGEDFAHSIVVLRSARNVKYGDFVEPGKVLTVTAEVLSQDETMTKVKASGTVGGRTSLTARLVLERYNLADRQPHGAALDARVRAEMRRLWSLLHPAARTAAITGAASYAVPHAAALEGPEPAASLSR